MNWNLVAGQLRELKGIILEEWGTITGDEHKAVAGKREQLVGRLQVRSGVRKEPALRTARVPARTHT